jgi:hypothetical protein
MNTRADNVNICTAAWNISFMVMSSAIIYPATTRAHDFFFYRSQVNTKDGSQVANWIQTQY